MATRILLAHLDDPWRASMREAFELESELEVRVTDDGTELLRMLTQPSSGPAAVVVGPGLRTLSGPDALFQAERQMKAAGLSRDAWPVRVIALVTEVRADVDLLELLRQRGVTVFLYGAEPAQRSKAEVMAAVFARRRAHDRLLVELPIDLEFGGTSARARTVDLSQGGSMMTVPTKKMKVLPGIGARVVVELTHNDRAIRLDGEVRRVSEGRRFFQGQVTLAIRFVDLSEQSLAALSELILSIKQQEQLLMTVPF